MSDSMLKVKQWIQWSCVVWKLAEITEIQGKKYNAFSHQQVNMLSRCMRELYMRPDQPVWYEVPKPSLISLNWILILGSMNLSGFGYHFAQETQLHGKTAMVSYNLEERGFPISLKVHATNVQESRWTMRSDRRRVRGFVARKLLKWDVCCSCDAD